MRVSEQHMRCHLISTSVAYNLSYKLALKILDSGYKPDVIVAVARGGFVPARFLCDFLQISDMVSVRVQHYLAGAQKLQQAFVKYPLPSSLSLSGRKVLLVDDVNDTGESLEAAAKHVSSFQPDELRTAVLHQKSAPRWKADYSALSLRKWVWIIYPWAASEDVGSFISKMKPRPHTAMEAASRLEEDYGIRINPHLLNKIMRILRYSDSKSGHC